MQGMSEEELLKLSMLPETYKRPRDVTVDDYGHGKWLRKFAYYPSFLPIYSHMDHAVYCFDEVLPSNLNTNMPSVFFYSQGAVEYYKKHAKDPVPAYHLECLFPFCRKQLKIEKDVNAKGTLAFPAHNTENLQGIVVEQDLDKYINELKKLPDEFQPIGVCLYWLDVQMGLYKPYMDAGLPVFTAGHMRNYDFTENFYKILQKFKFTTSTDFGSYVGYSVEMGLPFFLYGERANYNDSEYTDLPNEVQNGSVDSYYDLPRSLEFFKLFGEITTTISPEQKTYVDYSMSTGKGVSRLHAAYILYTSFLKRKLRIFTRKWIDMKLQDFKKWNAGKKRE